MNTHTSKPKGWNSGLRFGTTDGLWRRE